MTEPTTTIAMGGDHQRTTPGPALTLAELRQLPAAVDLMTAARALRIGRTMAYRLALEGRFPCPVLRIGRSYHVPVAGLLELLGATRLTEASNSDEIQRHNTTG
jgi:hypothetical protein